LQSGHLVVREMDGMKKIRKNLVKGILWGLDVTGSEKTVILDSLN